MVHFNELLIVTVTTRLCEDGYEMVEKKASQSDTKIPIRGYHSVSHPRVTVSRMLEKGTQEILLQMGKGLERKKDTASHFLSQSISVFCNK